jgi:hypothetical protein
MPGMLVTTARVQSFRENEKLLLVKPLLLKLLLDGPQNNQHDCIHYKGVFPTVLREEEFVNTDLAGL